MYYGLVYSDELYHHGVKGMKWGVRKERESLGRKYRRFASKKVNQYYDKKETQLKERRRRASNEVNNSIIPSKRYNNWVAKKNKERYDKKAKQLKSDRGWRLNKINNSRPSVKEGMKSIGKDVGNFIKTHKKQIAMAGVATGTVIAVGLGAYAIKKMGIKSVPVRKMNGKNIVRGEKIIGAVRKSRIKPMNTKNAQVNMLNFANNIMDRKISTDQAIKMVNYGPNTAPLYLRRFR